MKRSDVEPATYEVIEVSLNEMESLILTLKSKVADLKESIKEGTIQAEVIEIERVMK